MAYSFQQRDTCPACGADSTHTVYSSAFSAGGIGTFIREYYKVDPTLLDGAPYELQQCPRCDLVYQHYVGERALLTDVYTKWCWQPADPDVDYPAYKEHISEYKLSPSGHEVMAIASFLRMPYSKIKLLDYGMGWGMFIRIAKKFGVDAYGLELSQSQVEYARRNGIKTITDEEIPQHRFHFINTEQVFEHVTEPKALLETLAASLEPGGIVKISVPSGERVEQLIAMLKGGTYGGDYPTIMPIHPLEHVNTFRRRTLQVMADMNGLRSVPPSLRLGYSFLGKGGLSIRRPKKSLKELVRPLYGLVRKSNLAVWLQKSA